MENADVTERLKNIVASMKRGVFFGGAGVSTESGIPDFRSEDGLYRMKYKYPPERMLSHSFFLSHTEEFFEFYRDKMLYLDARPNAAHVKLAEWEKEGRLAAVVTQNIDGLHRKAGSRNVLELHGSVLRNHCMDCGRSYPVDYVASATGVPRCECGGIVKPDVVLYEEPLDDDVLEAAVDAIRSADTLIVGGTSLNVYPAAGLIDFFGGKNLVVINKGATARGVEGALYIDSPIAEFLSKV